MAIETIQEFTDSRGCRLAVDRDGGVIRGVKLLGLESRNGRTYPKETVVRALQLYEGVKVNVDHAQGKPGGPRSYSERIGVIRNVSLDSGDGGLRGDFHANPKHALFEQLAWDAENSPESVGFSHNIVGKTKQHRGQTVVEEITRVTSVDLVADPATTRGLFEQVGDTTLPEKEENDVELKDLTSAVLEAERPDLVKAFRETALEEHANSEEAKATTARLKELTEENDRFRAAALLQEQREKIDKALAEAKLPEALVTDVFRQTLTEAKDETAVKALIEDRAAMAKQAASKPRSKEQVQEGEEGEEGDGEEFSADEVHRRLTKSERRYSHVG
jgi:hypothetical protein